MDVHLTAFTYHPTTCQCNPRSRISWRNIRKARRQARILHETNVHLRNKLAEPAEELARPGHFCDSSRTITMNHRTRSTVKSLELAGNEKSRLDRLAILSPSSSTPAANANPLLAWFLHPRPSEIRLESRNRKVVLRRGWESRIFHGEPGSVFHPLPFDFPVNRSFIPHPATLALANQVRETVSGGRRSDDQLEKLNYLAK